MISLHELSHADLDTISEKFKDVCRDCEHCVNASYPSCNRLDADLIEHILEGNECPEGKW